MTAFGSAACSGSRSLVAVAVPLSNRMGFTEEEEISLRHLNRHLSQFDRYFIIPENQDINLGGFHVKRFPADFFGSVDAHRKLLFSTSFYEAFGDYRFILIYHLDALVFSNQLVKWCETGFDYIAAPWIRHPDAPYFGNPEYEGKVGNGGFSLRCVQSFLAVLNSRKLWRNPFRCAAHDLLYGTFHDRCTRLKNLFHYWHPKHNGIQHEMASYRQNEDHFWPNRASHYYAPFKVAPINIALQFAFECVPRYCYELNERKLPFGCHAWGRYDRDFWLPHLIAKAPG
jgi:hypothetical protein